MALSNESAVSLEAARSGGLQAGILQQYHEYLDRNYEGGVNRFFSPTGALKRFQKTVLISAHRTREHVIVKSVDDATSKLQPVVNGGEGVFDLTAEPGSGKTSILPFRFVGKKVVVAMPTPFDAWSAYQMASGDAMLRLKGLKLGTHEDVCYMDSYLAANMLLSGFIDYDILIVDECDSGKGVTSFLADVKAPGKVLIRMSASHGRTQSGPSKSFQVTEDNSLPDIRLGVRPFADRVNSEATRRTLVLTPDAETADQVAVLVPGSKVVSANMDLRALAESIVDQTSDGIFVADDVCARGLNLNIDMLIDCQLVTEHGVTRNLTDAELYQRKFRVGRNKPGWYLSPGLPTMAPRESDADVMRSNILRAFAGLDQVGSEGARIDPSCASDLLCSSVEPISVYRPIVSIRQPRAPSVPRSVRTSSMSSTDSDKSKSITVSPPSWLNWLMPTGATEVIGNRSYYVSESRSVGNSISKVPVAQETTLAVRSGHRRKHSKELPVAEAAPYAVALKPAPGRLSSAINVPAAPPIVDLTELEYHMDWPALVRDRVASGKDLPTIIPPGNWRHTSTGGMGTNWLARLESVALSELSFVESEFEVVCRAWNKMVAQAWVRRTPGLSSLDYEDRIEFCVRYFQSYFQMVTM